VELAATLPKAQIPQLADAAVMLCREARMRQTKALPRMVKRMLKRYGALPVRVDVPLALSPKEQQEFAALFMQLLKMPLSVDFVERPSLIGGARIQIGDDRIDCSYRGALNQIPAAFSSFHS
jgi:F0F1-type ATP synthase delta subunit